MVREQLSVGRGLVTLAAVLVLFGGVYLAASLVGFVLLAVFFALLCLSRRTGQGRSKGPVGNALAARCRAGR